MREELYEGRELTENELEEANGGGILLGAAIVGAGLALSYGAGYVVGKVISKKTGVCS